MAISQKQAARENGMTGENARISSFLAGFRFFFACAAILSLILTLAEDACLIAGISWDIRSILAISGFCLDLAFSALFLGHSASVLKKGNLRSYLGSRLGWLDMLSSLPILIFFSGPMVFGILLNVPESLSSGTVFGIAGMLHAARAFRTFRALRLARLISEDPVLPRSPEQARLRYIAIASAAFILVSATLPGFISTFALLPLDEQSFERERIACVTELSTLSTSELSTAAEIRKDLLLVQISGKDVFTRLSGSMAKSGLYPDGYREIMLPGKSISAIFDARPSNRLIALSSIASMVISLCFIASMGLLSSSIARRAGSALVAGEDSLDAEDRETVRDSQAISQLLNGEHR